MFPPALLDWPEFPKIPDALALMFLVLVATISLRGQAAVEFGGLASGSAGVIASKPPVPKVAPAPAATGNSQAVTTATPKPVVVANSTTVSAVTPDAAARTNQRFFQEHSGSGAASISVRSSPDHARAWIDTRFVGTTPLDLKLVPGHHRVMVRIPGAPDSVRDLDLAPKQKQSIDFAP